jgi:hypothetical protein
MQLKEKNLERKKMGLLHLYSLRRGVFSFKRMGGLKKKIYRLARIPPTAFARATRDITRSDTRASCTCLFTFASLPSQARYGFNRLAAQLRVGVGGLCILLIARSHVKFRTRACKKKTRCRPVRLMPDSIVKFGTLYQPCVDAVPVSWLGF